VGRLKEELVYIAKKAHKFSGIALTLHDDNFGMYRQDEEVADCIRSLQDEYKWPATIHTATGKRNYKRILNIASRLRNVLQVTCSVQSLNPKTLDVIKRVNIPMDQYSIIQKELKERGMLSMAELIMPLPEETKSSYHNGIKSVIEAGVKRVVPYTTMMLKGTYLDSNECRTKYNMKTKYRILPLQFGEYIGEKCFEIEEVCVATNTMSYEEYIECREFAFVSSLFSSLQFDIILKLVEEMEINIHEYFMHFWKIIRTCNSELEDYCSNYVKETEGELWDSPEEIYAHFVKKNNYNKLLKREVGDNLIRKYTTKVILESFIPFVELSFVAIGNLTDPGDTKIIGILDAIKHWMISHRNVSALFSNESYINKEEILHFPFDASGWYLNQDQNKRLVGFDIPCSYRVAYNKNELIPILEEGEKLHGNNIGFKAGRLLDTWGINKFWRICEKL
jgi:hypothetical protein